MLWAAKIMRLLFYLLIFRFCIVQCSASTHNAPHVSPDGRFTIYNLGDTAYGDHYFEIRTKDETVVYSLRQPGGLEFGTHAEEIQWNRGSRFALFRVQHGQFDSTCIFTADDGELKHLESADEDSWTVPVRWAGTRTFIATVSGPHGHNARMSWWHYCKSYRVSSHPFTLECIYAERKIYEKEEATDEK